MAGAASTDSTALQGALSCPDNEKQQQGGLKQYLQKQQEKRQEPQHQRDTELRVEQLREMSSNATDGSDPPEGALALHRLKELPAIQENVDEARQRQESVPFLAAVAAAAAQAAVDVEQAAVEEKKVVDREHQEQTLKKRLFMPEKKQVFLWTLKTGLTPIAAGEVYCNSVEESALETPNGAAAAAAAKASTSLEEETPRTALPSSEVSPTNNVYSCRSSVSSCAPSTSTAANSPSSSSSTASPPQTATGAGEGGDSDIRYCFSDDGSEEPGRIHARKEVFSKDGHGVDTTSSLSTGNKEDESSTPGRTACQVAQALPLSNLAAAAASHLLNSTAAQAAAVFSSPAALSLLATPCPFPGGTTVRAAGCTACVEKPAMRGRVTDTSVPRAVAAENIKVEDDVKAVVVDVAGKEKGDGTAAVSTAASTKETTQEETNVAAGAARAGFRLPNVKGMEKEAKRLQKEHQAALKIILERLPYEEGHLQIPGERKVQGVSPHTKKVTQGDDSAAVVKGDTLAGNVAAVLESAAVCEERGSGGMNFISSHAGGAVGKAERHRESPVLWKCRSQLDAALEEDTGAVATAVERVSERLSESTMQEHRLGHETAEDSSAACEDVTASGKSLSASCCTEFSAPPFTAASKEGDSSPISCCSSSSTASVTSPTSTSLSSASCNTFLFAAAASGAAAAANVSGIVDDASSTHTATGTPVDGDVAAVELRDTDNNIANIKDAAASVGAARENMPTWCPGFRLPLGAEGRQVLLRRLRRAYHAASPKTRDAVLASHGLYFSRVPFATVSDLFKLSHLLGVFDFAVQCSHEFGGGGGALGLTGGSGGTHGNNRSQHHHPKNTSKANNSGQRQHCSGASSSGEKKKPAGSSAVAGTDHAALNPAFNITPAATVALAIGPGPRQKKSTGTVPKSSGAAAAGNCVAIRKSGGGCKAAAQVSPTQAGTNKERAAVARAAAAASGSTLGFEEDMVNCVAFTKDRMLERDVLLRSGEKELQTILTRTAAVSRSRLPQHNRSAARQSSASRGGARQQKLQHVHDGLTTELQTYRISGPSADRCNSDVGNSADDKDYDRRTQQQLALRQLLHAGRVNEAGSAHAGRSAGTKTPEEEILALLSGEYGQPAAAAAATALVLPSTGIQNAATGLQRHQTEFQRLLVQLQERGKGTLAASFCRGGKCRELSQETSGASVDEQQILRCFLSEMLQGWAHNEQQEQQLQGLEGKVDHLSGRRVGGKRTCRSGDTLLQHEQVQRLSRLPSTAAAGEESTRKAQLHEAAAQAQVTTTAGSLPFLSSAAELLRAESCSMPDGAAAEAESSLQASFKTEGKVLRTADLSGRSSRSASSTNFEWNSFLVEEYLKSIRNQQQQQQKQEEALLPSTCETTRAHRVCAAAVAAEVVAGDHVQQEQILEEEETRRLTKKRRTTRPSTAALQASTAGGADSVAGILTASAAAGPRAGVPGQDGVPETYMPEEREALLSALLGAGGASACERQQEQRRSTFNTVDEITRLLLQLSNANSGSGAVTEELCRGDPERRVNILDVAENLRGDEGCKHVSGVPYHSCARKPVESACYTRNCVISSSVSKGGRRAECDNDGNMFPHHLGNVSPAATAWPAASLARLTTGIPATDRHGDAGGSAFSGTFNAEKRTVLAYEAHEKCNVVPSSHGNSASVVDQQQHEETRHLSALHGIQKSRCSYSNTADASATDVYIENLGHTSGSGSGNNNRNPDTDVFLQLTSQLQALSAQVLQHHGPNAPQQHAWNEDSTLEHPHRQRQQLQRAWEALKNKANVSSRAADAASASQSVSLLVPTAAAAADVVAAPASGRLCTAEKTSEYAADVQVVQLAELLQVQQRLSKLLDLFPKTPATGSSSPTLPDPTTAASTFASPYTTTAALLLPGRPAVPAASSAEGAVALVSAEASSTIEPPATLLAALASGLLEGNINGSLINSAMQGRATSAHALVSLASEKIDGTKLARGTGSSESLRQLSVTCDVRPQHPECVQSPKQSPSFRRSNKNDSSTARSGNNSCTCNEERGSNCKNSSQCSERRVNLERTELLEGPLTTETVDKRPPARNEDCYEGAEAEQEQREATASKCVAHSNSFSTCCSEDFVDLCTSGGGSITSKLLHGSSGSALGGLSSGRATCDRPDASDTWSVRSSESRDDMNAILMH